jgi:CRISPR-associated protein Csb2
LIHGHHDGTRRQVAFLVLPFVGTPRATGQLLGVALCPSADLGPDLRRALLQLLGLDRDDGPRLQKLNVPGLSRFPLHHPDGRKTLEASSWQGPRETWSTVTPIVLDRWPKRSCPVDVVVSEGCQMAGYPEPLQVDVRPVSAVPGAAWTTRTDTRRRRGEPVRPTTHAVITFDRPVKGPVVVGHLRHLGLGLCWPGRPA